MKIADHWTYPGGDSCADFWTACVKASNLEIPDTAHVLEIGCAEFDWLSPASKSFPEMTFVGVDWRIDSDDRERLRVVKSDVRNPNLFPPETFDWIVSISAIEHIGLGHYNEDPKDPDGDIVALANAFSWLKVGGTIMFDVPYNPERYAVMGTSHREYDDRAARERFWAAETQSGATVGWQRSFFCEAGKESELLPDRPTVPLANSYHYVCLIAQKIE